MSTGEPCAVCGATHLVDPEGDLWQLHCDLDPGHEPPHAAIGLDGCLIATWTDGGPFLPEEDSHVRWRAIEELRGQQDRAMTLIRHHEEAIEALARDREAILERRRAPLRLAAALAALRALADTLHEAPLPRPDREATSFTERCREVAREIRAHCDAVDKRPAAGEKSRQEPSLDDLLTSAKAHTSTPEELEAQRRSFAYGNTKLSNDAITRDHVDRAAEALTARDQIAAPCATCVDIMRNDPRRHFKGCPTREPLPDVGSS